MRKREGGKKRKTERRERERNIEEEEREGEERKREREGGGEGEREKERRYFIHKTTYPLTSIPFSNHHTNTHSYKLECSLIDPASLNTH